jgi:hypothetical protein
MLKRLVHAITCAFSITRWRTSIVIHLARAKKRWAGCAAHGLGKTSGCTDMARVTIALSSSSCATLDWQPQWCPESW